MSKTYVEDAEHLDATARSPFIELVGGVPSIVKRIKEIATTERAETLLEYCDRYIGETSSENRKSIWRWIMAEYRKLDSKDTLLGIERRRHAKRMRASGLSARTKYSAATKADWVKLANQPEYKNKTKSNIAILIAKKKKLPQAAIRTIRRVIK